MTLKGRLTLSGSEDRFARELATLLRVHRNELVALELGKSTAPIVGFLAKAEVVSDCGIIITRGFDPLRDIELRLVDHLRPDVCIPVLRCGSGETWGDPIYFEPEESRQ